MDLAKFKRVLKKEFTRSPAKTCILLGLLPVALYFIVPLVTGRGKGELTIEKVSTAGVVAVVSPPVPQPRADTEIGWQTLRKARRADRFTATVSEVPGKRNPFRFPPGASELAADPDIEDDEDEDQLQEVAAVDPSQFLLTATLYGAKTRLATINGRTYRENQFLRSSADPSELLRWFVSRVGPNFVVLELEGREYLLRLRSSESLANGILISRP